MADSPSRDSGWCGSGNRTRDDCLNPPAARLRGLRRSGSQTRRCDLRRLRFSGQAFGIAPRFARCLFRRDLSASDHHPGTPQKSKRPSGNLLGSACGGGIPRRWDVGSLTWFRRTPQGRVMEMRKKEIGLILKNSHEYSCWHSNREI